MRPKSPKHKQRDMSVRCRHKDSGWRFAQRREDRAARMAWRNLRVKLVKGHAKPAEAPEPKTVEVVYCVPARLDADGTAQPKTRLLAHVRLDGNCKRMDHADSAIYYEANGVRTPLD
jgi:hypothetical protein